MFAAHINTDNTTPYIGRLYKTYIENISFHNSMAFTKNVYISYVIHALIYTYIRYLPCAHSFGK